MAPSGDDDVGEGMGGRGHLAHQGAIGSRPQHQLEHPQGIAPVGDRCEQPVPAALGDHLDVLGNQGSLVRRPGHGHRLQPLGRARMTLR